MKPLVWSRDSVMRCAARLLSYRDRSEKELFERLTAKGIPGELVADVVAALKENGLVNDDRLAGNIARMARENRHLGRRGVRAFLLRRGIPAGLADEAAGRDDDYLATARLLAEKRLSLGGGRPDDAALKRVWGFLARRGFSAEIIRTTLKNLTGKHL